MKAKQGEVVTVDLFCGAGGESTGMGIAVKRCGLKQIGIAINHWERAVQTMMMNHPDITTYEMDIAAAIPSKLVPGGVVDLLHASPSCTHHSRAKGGRPRNDQLRSQAAYVTQWIDELIVKHITVENVPEFLDWGPLNVDGKPIKHLRGACFRAWVEDLKARNYKVEWRIVNCADYGDATTRRRLFIKAVRRGFGRIRWPQPTHAENPVPDSRGHMLKPWRGICECLDLSDTGRSIFDRDHPLAANTLRRIAVGMAKFNGMDFLLDMFGSDKSDYTRQAQRHCRRCVRKPRRRVRRLRPFIVRLNRNCHAESVDSPLSTVTANGQHHMLCYPIIVDHFRNGKAQSVNRPIGSQTTHDRYSVVTPLVLGQHGGAACRPISKPCPTITVTGAIRGVFPVLEDGRIIDIRIRMLKPSELAAAHSFPKDYIITGTRAEQVKQIGNSVPVMTAAAMCEADLRAA